MRVSCLVCTAGLVTIFLMFQERLDMDTIVRHVSCGETLAEAMTSITRVRHLDDRYVRSLELKLLQDLRRWLRLGFASRLGLLRVGCQPYTGAAGAERRC